MVVQGFARSDSLDTLATKFLDTAADAKSSIVDEITSAAGALAGEAKSNADLYMRFAKKAIEKVSFATFGDAMDCHSSSIRLAAQLYSSSIRLFCL